MAIMDQPHHRRPWAGDVVRNACVSLCPPPLFPGSAVSVAESRHHTMNHPGFFLTITVFFSGLSQPGWAQHEGHHHAESSQPAPNKAQPPASRQRTKEMKPVAPRHEGSGHEGHQMDGHSMEGMS